MLLLCNLLYAVVVFACRTLHIINACKTYNLWVFFRVQKTFIQQNLSFPGTRQMEKRLKLFPLSLYGRGGSTNNHKLVTLKRTFKRLFFLNYYCQINRTVNIRLSVHSHYTFTNLGLDLSKSSDHVKSSIKTTSSITLKVKWKPFFTF